MLPFKCIVAYAAMDRRDPNVFRHAAWFARSAGADVVYVAHIEPSFDLPEDPKTPDKAIGPVDEEVLIHLCEDLALQPDLFPEGTRVECLVREGAFPYELVRLASHKSADLICVGRLHPGDVDPIGDSAVNLLRKSPCSVLIIPEDDNRPPDRILVPTDFSETSREALDVALTLAASTPGAAITLLHVDAVPVGYTRSGLTYDQMAARIREHAVHRWSEIHPHIDFHGIPWTMRHEVGPSIPSTILSVAQEIDTRLIIIGSHGRTRPASALLGHAADTVGSKTTRAFLCVKKRGKS